MTQDSLGTLRTHEIRSFNLQRRDPRWTEGQPLVGHKATKLQGQDPNPDLQTLSGQLSSIPTATCPLCVDHTLGTQGDPPPFCPRKVLPQLLLPCQASAWRGLPGLPSSTAPQTFLPFTLVNSLQRTDRFGNQLWFLVDLASSVSPQGAQGPHQPYSSLLPQCPAHSSCYC